LEGTASKTSFANTSVDGGLGIMTASTPHFLHNYVRYINIMFEGAFFMSSEAIMSDRRQREF
jgi:hypothetical protein